MRERDGDDDDEEEATDEDGSDIAKLREQDRFKHLSRREAFENVHRTNSPGARWIGGLTGAQAVAYYRSLFGNRLPQNNNKEPLRVTSDPGSAGRQPLPPHFMFPQFAANNGATVAAAASGHTAQAPIPIPVPPPVLAAPALLPGHPRTPFCNVPDHQNTFCVDFHYYPPPYFDWDHKTPQQDPKLLRQQLLSVPPDKRAKHPLWRAILVHRPAKRARLKGKLRKKPSSSGASTSSEASDKNSNKKKGSKKEKKPEPKAAKKSDTKQKTAESEMLCSTIIIVVRIKFTLFVYS